MVASVDHSAFCFSRDILHGFGNRRKGRAGHQVIGGGKMRNREKTGECETIEFVIRDKEAEDGADAPRKYWTFAVKLGKIPPFFMVRKRRRWEERLVAIASLDGLAAVTPVGTEMVMVHMDTGNDAIIAKNRLRFLGIPVSKEAHETDIKEWGVFVAKDYVNQKEESKNGG